MPPELIQKPGKLTDEEFRVIRQHPILGYQMLVRAGFTNPVVLDVCRHHHERMDGGGYPDNLRASDLTLLARMGAICDVYDAITLNRPYKAGWDPAESIARKGLLERPFRRGHAEGVHPQHRHLPDRFTGAPSLR